MSASELGTSGLSACEHEIARLATVEPVGEGRDPSPSIDVVLGRILAGVDLAFVSAAWLGVTMIQPTTGRVVVAVAAALASFAWLVGHGMYRAPSRSGRLHETAHLYEAGAVGAVVANMLDSHIGVRLGAFTLLSGALLAAVLLHLGRCVYASRLLRANRRGRHLRPAVVVGPGAEVADLTRRFLGTPELGYVVAATFELPDADVVSDMARSVGGRTVMVAPGAASGDTLARLVRGTTSQGIDVHLLGSMNGIDARRVRPVPFGHEASLHVSGVSLDGWQAVVKRVFDLTTSVVILILAAPLFLCVAAAIKCNDRGPVFFSQERIGRNGRPFRMWKFRSMVVDAEARLAEVEASNARSGPLFKAARDPRITKVGQVLRATSIDELPQVFNVIRGDMSLVGPRPALAREVEQFSPELQRRSAVLPGVTGIWQIEGRDEPDFSIYEEADIFYVENWSVTLDVAILVRTFFSILARAARYRPRRKDGTRLVLE
jgi:exopolysaccharide biosynthesis polyprenyl glycosylphosphotransferase